MSAEPSRLLQEKEKEKKEAITGKITKRVFFSPDNRFCVLRLSSSSYSSEVSCVGFLPPHLFPEGEVEDCEVEVLGSWRVGKYGREFRFEEIHLKGADETVFFIKLIKGIGPSLIKKIRKRFPGTELVRVLNEEPERLLEVPGIGKKKLEEIVESWEKAQRFRRLYSFFEQAGAGNDISPALIIKIYDHFENKNESAIEAISRNPYRLTEIRGIGFKTADRIALALGTDERSPERFLAGIKYVLRKAADTEGDTLLPEDELVEKIKEELFETDAEDGEINTLIRSRIDELVESSSFLVDIPHRGTRLIGLASLVGMELDVLDDLSARRDEPFPGNSPRLSDVTSALVQFENAVDIALEQEQIEFVLRATSFEHSIYALIGYAGTGKTTTLRAFLHVVFETGMFSPHEVVCCAFTGMAARRIREVTGFWNCKTIHSLLEWNGRQFTRGPGYPLDEKLVIVDEAGMINLSLFHALLSALSRDTLLVIVGDPAQLPPIGAGNVFGDLVRARNIPIVELTKIKRQSADSVITLVANEVRRGLHPGSYLTGNYRDFEFIRIENPEIWKLRRMGVPNGKIRRLREENNRVILNEIVRLAKDALENGFDAGLFQVLSPMKIGILGTQSLNSVLQDVFNPPAPGKIEVSKRGLTLRRGDRIINLENRDLPSPRPEAVALLGEGGITAGKLVDRCAFERFLNGQTGKVVAIFPEDELILAKMEDVVDRYVFFGFEDIARKIDLAYCLTVHKAQGSQYPVVVVPLTASHWFMLNNQWLYTAITRAQRKCILVGEESALRRAATNTETRERLTYLSLLGPPQGE